MATRKASSSTDGFFQALPVLPPLFTAPEQLTTSHSAQSSNYKAASDDKALARVLALYLPPGEEEPRRTLHNLSRLSLDPELLAHSVDAETNHPVVKAFNTFGQENKVDSLWTTAGWKALKAIYQEQGLISVAYDKNNRAWNRRVHQFALNHAYICTATMTGCPMSMTDGAAKLMEAHLDTPSGDQPGLKEVVNEVYRRLVSNNPSEAWTSGQWMTERTGGSDVSGTETVATRLTPEELAEEARQGRNEDAHGMPLGPWRIDGFKWFSSATDSDMTMMLAQTSKGLSLFYAPLRRRVAASSQTYGQKQLSELNGIRIQRLKEKLGTKSLPTAELELKGVRAWLIGQEGRGVKQISTILNTTRLYTAHGGVGYWARGLQICRAYSKTRKIRGGLLSDNHQHLRWMANETIKYTAATQFSFFGIAMLGTIEQGLDALRNVPGAGLIPENKEHLETLLRLLTPVMKSKVSVASVTGLRETMECLGGVGYCENNEDGGILNIARVFRDAQAGPIWEGTVSVMAEDVVRVLTDKRIADGKVIDAVYGPWVRLILSHCEGVFPEERDLVLERLEALRDITARGDKEHLLFRGRELLDHLEAITCACLLIFDAFTDKDEVAVAIARSWARSNALVNSKVNVSSLFASWLDESTMNKKIFLGAEQGLSGRIAGKL